MKNKNLIIIVIIICSAIGCNTAEMNYPEEDFEFINQVFTDAYEKKITENEMVVRLKNKFPNAKDLIIIKDVDSTSTGTTLYSNKTTIEFIQELSLSKQVGFTSKHHFIKNGSMYNYFFIKRGINNEELYELSVNLQNDGVRIYNLDLIYVK